MSRQFLLPPTRGKWTVFSCLFFFACSQVLLSVYLHRCRPELCDPVFGHRLRLLRSRIAEQPDAKLVLIMGTSRSMNGVWPDAFGQQLEQSGSNHLVYNFSVSAGSPIRQMLHLRHLRAQGIRPEWVLFETWPPLWVESDIFDDARAVIHDDLVVADVPMLYRYFPKQLAMFQQALEGELAPISAHRTRLLGASARSLLPPMLAGRFVDEMKGWTPPDRTGWIPVLTPPNTPEGRHQELERGRRNIKPLVNPLRIDERRDQALRELLDYCRASGIKTALFVMPDHSEVRQWYTPSDKARIRNYLGAISREYHVPVIDTRDWVPDEGFADVAHMERWAAAPFSERFGREVVQPLLEDRPLDASIVFGEPLSPKP